MSFARMKTLSVVVSAALLLSAGCSKKQAEVSSAAQKEAAMLMSEAQFAMQVREYARAQELVERAVKLNPTLPEYWVSLGITRRRQDDRDGARKAYKQALELHEERYKAIKTPQEVVQQAYVLGLLGRTDDAMKLLEKGVKEFPESTELKRVADPRGLLRTFQSPEFKERAI